MSIEIYDFYEHGVVSSCCGARVIMIDICSDCKEHCEAVKEEDEENEQS